MGKLDRRVAIVTGASSGVGRGCALRYACEGASVIACARRVERMMELAKEAEEKGYSGKNIYLSAEISPRKKIWIPLLRQQLIILEELTFWPVSLKAGWIS